MWRLSGLGRCGFALLATVVMAQARADVVDVTISVPGLANRSSVLAFDFIPGGFAPGNQVTLSTLTTSGAGAIASTSTTGDVTGSGPWVFGDGSFFNELLVTLDPTGDAVSFTIDTTDLATGSTSDPPDSFSFFIIDIDLVTPLVVTDDPTGSNAVFQFDLGRGASGLRAFSPVQDAEFPFAIEIAYTPSTPVPEPSTAWLLAWLGAALALKRRDGRGTGRV